MGFRLVRFAPQASTRTMQVPVRWTGLDECAAGSRFLSWWLGDDDSDGSRVNWGAIAGLALSFVIGGGFWAVVELLAVQALK